MLTLLGMWLVAEGKRVEYAEEVYSTTQSEDGKKVSLLCPTMQIRSRGDTLNRPTITVVSAPLYHLIALD
jgi:alpha-D-xyloside xylohydrolase